MGLALGGPQPDRFSRFVCHGVASLEAATHIFLHLKILSAFSYATPFQMQA